MKKEYQCTWWTIPDCKVHIATYPTLETAQVAMATIVRDVMKPQKYIDKLRREKDPDALDTASFMEKFFTDLRMPASGEAPVFCGQYLGECHSDDTEFLLEYCWGEYLVINARHQWGYDELPEAYITSVTYENPNKTTRYYGVQTEIVPTFSGTSVYPLLIWEMLGITPQTRDAIIKSVRKKYNVEMEKKAVGRHLKMLQNMGFPVQHNVDGYCCGGKFRDPVPGVKLGASAYPMMISQVLDETPKTQTAIKQAVFEKYGKKMDRKAVSRNLTLLEELEYNIQKCKDGYYISK